MASAPNLKNFAAKLKEKSNAVPQNDAALDAPAGEVPQEAGPADTAPAPQANGMAPETENALVSAGMELGPQLLGLLAGGYEGAEAAKKNVSEPFRERMAAVAKAQAEAEKEIRASMLKHQENEFDRALKKGQLGVSEYEAKTKRMALDKEKRGKELTAQQTESLSGHDSSMQQLADIENMIQQAPDSFGPVAGRLAGMNPYNTTQKSIEAMTKIAAQNIGKSLEGGKLTDQDIERYRKMLPNTTDTPDVALSKIGILKRLIQQRRSSDLNAFGRAGYNVEQFEMPSLPQQQAMVSQPAQPGLGEVLASHGIDPAKVQAYAQAHGLAPEQAAQIIINRKAALSGKK